MPGQSADGKTIIKAAAYSYEYRSDVHLAGIARLSASLMANEYELESMILASDLIKKGDYYWPVPYTTNITSHFQKNRLHPITGEIRDHNGVDIAIQGVENKQAVSITDGIVTFAGWIDGYGNVVEVMHENNLTTRYAHLNKFLVSKGDLVSGGDVVGLIGSTGNSTNPHLHFEALVDGTFINPLTLFE